MYVRFKYIWRVAGQVTPPATVVLNNRPFAGKGPSLKLSQKWIDYCWAINSERAAKYLLRAKSGWVNGLTAEGRRSPSASRWAAISAPSSTSGPASSWCDRFFLIRLCQLRMIGCWSTSSRA
jgi:hypothetical protein